MKKQIEVAVAWWSKELQTVTEQQTGDGTLNVGLLSLAFSESRPSSEAVVAFGCALRLILYDHLKQSWRPSEPDWGSYIRAIGCDYEPDAVLSKAAKLAGITANCPPFPVKTIMWIDPDGVSVRHGYGAEVQRLWLPEHKAKEK